MLSTGLLICAPGGIASADSENNTGNGSHNTSSSSSQGSDNDSDGGPSKSHGVGPVSKSVRKAVRDAIDSVSSPGNPRSSIPDRPGATRSPRTKTPAAPSGTGQTGSDTGTAGGSTAADATGEDATPAPGTAAPTPGADPADVTAEPTPPTATPASETAVAPAEPLSESSTSAPVTHSVKPLHGSPTAVAPPHAPTIPNLLTPTAAALFTSLTEMAASLGIAAVNVPALLLSLPTSPTPIADVIAFIETTLTSVTGAVVPLIQLPGDLASIMLGATWMPPVSTLAQPKVGPFIPALPPGPAMPLQWPTAPSVSTPQFFPVPDAAEFARRGGIAAAPILSGPAALAPDTALAETASSDGAAFIKGAVTALLVSVSLWALFTAALPGLSGLAAISATGVRIGYRQANAGAALRATGVARFAAGGPIGVVRSDSMVAVHVRPRHAANAAAAPVQPVRLRIVDRAA